MATVEERLLALSGRDGACLRFQGTSAGRGYRKVWFHGRMEFAHRVAYETWVGPIPTGKVIDHLCRVRDCIEPTHLEAVTQRENLLRGQGLTAAHAAATHCPQGHPYDEANTYYERKGRQCRACNTARGRARRDALAGLNASESERRARS